PLSLGEAINHFAVNLFQQIRQSEEENIFFSPLSIMSALAMTSLGAREYTASEIQKVGCSFLSIYQFVQVSLLASVQMITDLAVPRGITVKLLLIPPFFLPIVESADFVNAAEESRKMINSWVESQTNEKIKDLFPKDSLGSFTVLVLVNAVYFKGKWCQKFKKENTGEEKFWLNKDTSKSVQMMKQTDHFNFTSLEDMQVKILEIPYKGKELSMMVLLPNELDGLQKLEDQLTAEKLIEWTSPQNMRERQESYDLKATLGALGMVDAFTDQDTDFSGMTGRQDVVVSKVLHKSFVEVNEEGTEAAAATGIEIRTKTRLIPDSFRCDHPFLFFIKHNKTNSILFYGRVSSP
uniref:Serpin domain-containing protein n=1 Tax=Balaenoptera musculus TaxID=9771 RepID=A0A8C0I0J4_BALMU